MSIRDRPVADGTPLLLAHGLRMVDRYGSMSGRAGLLTRIDMKRIGHSCVALLLLMAVVGPVCFLMSPMAAGASDAPSMDCESAPGGPETSMDGCPHSDSADALAVSTSSAKFVPILAVVPAVAISPSVAGCADASTRVAVSAADTARIRPLRL